MSSSRLFSAPPAPPSTLLRKHAFEDHMQASEDAPSQPSQEHAGTVKKVLNWLHHHLLFGANAEKSGHEPASGQFGVGYAGNKRVTEDQENWNRSHPSHATTDPNMLDP